MVQWWFTHVAAPVQHGSTPIAFLQNLEGTSLLPMPGGLASPSDAPHSSGLARSNRHKTKSKGGQSSAPPAPYPPTETQSKNKGKGKNNKGNKGQGGKCKNKGAKGSSK